MLRINSLGVALMMVLMITVGCGSTQTKSPVMLEGAYRFSNIVTESNCMIPGITKGAWGNTVVEFSQNDANLTWSQFYVGEYMQGVQISKFKNNQAEFIDMKTNFITSQLIWNATISFSDTGFTGTGDFKVQECDGTFAIVGTRLHH